MEEVQEDRTKEGLDEFPPQVQEDVNGLAWLGYLEDHFEIFGHTFMIRTLKGDEELYAGILAKEYQDTLTQAKAWAWANVALCLVTVDGDSEFCPPTGPDPLANARARFVWTTSRWYWFLADYIWKRLLWLNSRSLRAAQAIRDLSQWSQEKSSPSPDSSTDSGDSEKPEILDLVED